jgi:endonuclease/exonuclease/phosphatase (EEP) superfamily protein YafD
MKKLLIISAIFVTATVVAKIQYPIPTEDKVLLELSKGKKPGLDPASIKILVWNIHKGQDKDFVKDFTYLSKNRDLLLVQEMYLDKKMNDLFLSMKDFGFKTATSFFDPRNPIIRTGVSSASTVEPIETKFVRTLNLEPAINTPKVTMITRYPIKGTDKILTVANIHAINFVTADIFRAEIERVFNELKKYPKPIIFVGDFNTWIGEKIFYLDQLRISMGMKEALFVPDFRMNRNDYYLDHFLYTDDLQVVSAKCEGKYLGSDHKPMEVELEYIGE